MQKWCSIKLYKAGEEYDIDLPLGDTAIILVDCWDNLVPDQHRLDIRTLIVKMRELNIPIVHANHGNPSVFDINDKDIVLQGNYSIKQLPKYLFYAGYETDKCVLGRQCGIPYAFDNNKIPILIKDLSETINGYDDLSPYMMRQAAVHIIEHCYGFTTTFEDVMDALNNTVITTAKRTIIEIGKVVVK